MMATALRCGSVLVWALNLFLAFASEQNSGWISLADGVEYTTFVLEKGVEYDGGRLHIIRIDPEIAELEVFLASQHDGKPRTAKQWVDEFNLIAAINAGMYAQDYRTNVGYLRNGEHLNNPKWHPQYKSVLAFGPMKKGLPSATIVDLDSEGSKESLSDYKTLIQNLRLIKGNGINVWSASDKAWSEAAVAMDKQNRILFIFCMAPFNMREFNGILLSLPLDIVKAMHVEGGPEASLSIRSEKINLDLCGSYEASLIYEKTCSRQWQIPNVLGVKRRTR